MKICKWDDCKCNKKESCEECTFNKCMKKEYDEPWKWAEALEEDWD